MTREEYFERWAATHGGLDPRTSLPVQFWLTITYVLAKPLVALRLSPDAVTLLGVAVAICVPWFVVRDQIAVASALAILAGVLDNLDGAVAVMSERTSDWGYVLDSVADRVGDTALLVGLGLAADNPWPAVAAAFLAFLQEYIRARAGVVGFTEIGVISLSERPTRVLIVAMFLLATAVQGPLWAQLGGWLALALSIVGIGQVAWAVRSRLHE